MKTAFILRNTHSRQRGYRTFSRRYVIAARTGQSPHGNGHPERSTQDFCATLKAEILSSLKRTDGRYPVTIMCQCLGLTTSSYYNWRRCPLSRRAQANQALLKEIRTIHLSGRGVYGSPKIHRILKKQGWPCSRKRVAVSCVWTDWPPRGNVASSERLASMQADWQLPNHLAQQFLGIAAKPGVVGRYNLCRHAGGLALSGSGDGPLLNRHSASQTSGRRLSDIPHDACQRQRSV